LWESGIEILSEMVIGIGSEYGTVIGTEIENGTAIELKNVIETENEIEICFFYPKNVFPFV
jgi:hypothetical protein